MFPGVRALRHRPFRNLWIGQTVSQFGDAAYGLVFIFMADRITKDPVFVGLVAALQVLPFLIVSPLAGVLADRLDRKAIMVVSDFGSVVVLGAFLALLKVTGEAPRWALLLVPCLLSSLNALFYPARGASIPRLVPPEDLLDANSFAAATMSLMHTIGLALSAFVLAQVERVNPQGFFETAVLINAATFVVSAGFLMTLPSIRPKREEHAGTGMVHEMMEGVAVVFRDRVLSRFLVVLLIVNLFIAGFMVVYTATNRAWFGGSFQTLAGIEIGFMVSMVVGSLLVAKANVQRVGMAYSVATALVGLAVAAMAVPSYGLYVAFNVVCGLLVPFINIPMATYMNLVVSDDVRGRVNSVAAMVSAGTQPLGAAVAGGLLPLLGLVGMYLFMGFGMFGAGLFGLADRSTRQALMPGPEPATEDPACQDRADGA